MVPPLTQFVVLYHAAAAGEPVALTACHRPRCHLERTKESDTSPESNNKSSVPIETEACRQSRSGFTPILSGDNSACGGISGDICSMHTSSAPHSRDGGHRLTLLIVPFEDCSDTQPNAGCAISDGGIFASSIRIASPGFPDNGIPLVTLGVIPWSFEGAMTSCALVTLSVG